MINQATKAITHIYPKGSLLKSDPGGWPTEPLWPVAPVIVISEKATISPDPSVPQNFVDIDVVYTVTAEDGSTLIYTVRAEREAQNGGEEPNDENPSIIK